MKIVVNTRFLIKNKLEGIGMFTAETFKRICSNHPEHEFIFLFDRHFPPEFIFSGNVKGVVLFPPARHPLLWYLWFQFSVKRFLKKEKPDLFISTDGFLPLRTKTPCLAVIHDLAFENYPKDIPLLVRKYYRFFFPKFAWKADRIATVSEFSKQDIIKWYSVKNDKIDVVFNGASDHFKAVDEKVKTEVKEKYTDGKDFFCYVGALHQRKNISQLLLAFDNFRLENECDIKLLIIGRKAWGTKEIEKIFHNMHFCEDVIFTGRLSDENLAQALASSLALTYISYFEGFGIPALEALHCDVPVIAADNTSLPEVVGDAGILVDPFELDDISIAMKNIFKNAKRRNDLIEKGRIQRMKFSWDKTAQLLWESIIKTIAQ
ncbi:glycosyltransferase family 4 protein [Bacteroidota bacterium]